MPAPMIKDPATPLITTLGFGSAVSAIAAIVVTPKGLVPGGAALSAAGVIAGNIVTLTLGAGSDGEHYDVTLRVTDVSNAVIARDIAIVVIDPLWSMADGSAGWLSIAEFAAKFGIEEVIAATDADQSGLIDRNYLIGALRDAQAEVQLNLAGRYLLPLSVVPDVIKAAIADLCAVRLYHRQVPDSVADAAKAQRATLKRIADGAVTLPGVAGVNAQAALVTSDPVVFYSDGRTYRDSPSGAVRPFADFGDSGW